MNKWTAEQQKSFVRQSDNYKKFIEGTFFEGYNAVEKLQGASNIAGTGDDLNKLVMKKVSQYNALRKTDPVGAKQLAETFDHITGIDISNQNDVEELQMKVESEGFVGIKDPSLRTIISKSKDSPTFRGSTDYSILQDSWLKADTYPDSPEYKLAVENLIGDLLPKWGRAEIMNEVGAW